MNDGLNLATIQQGDWETVLEHPTGEPLREMAASVRAGARRFWKARGRDEDGWTMRQSITASVRLRQGELAAAKEEAGGAHSGATNKQAEPGRKCPTCKGSGSAARNTEVSSGAKTP